MEQNSFKREIIIIIFATLVLSGIYLNLKIMLNQTFYQIFEGDLGINFNSFVVFLAILALLGTVQYLIRQDRPFHQNNEI